MIRSDNPARLSAQGWAALHAYGVRTVVALRTVGAHDVEPDTDMIPQEVVVERVELEDATDATFRRRCVDTGWWATPLQWAEMLRFWPDRCASAVRSVARAQPGGVLVSCGAGRDRTGLVVFLLLALVGVPVEVIARDWLRSTERLAQGSLAGQLPVFDILEREHTTVTEAIEAAVALDVESRLSNGGLAAEEIAEIRRRLLA